MLKNIIMTKNIAKNRISLLTKDHLKQSQKKQNQKGAVLLEALIAILIFSFGILAISGLQGAMIKNTTDSNYRAEASYIVQQHIGRMWTNPTNLTGYLGSQNAYATKLPSGTFTVSRWVAGTNRFQFIVTWTTPGEPTHNFTTNASIDP
jgi:type IV pilus assembly protein PilV